MSRLRIEVTGVVQGVGFRPAVWRLARELGLAGFVRNSSAGVEIEVEGARAGQFAEALRASAPPLARVASLAVREVPALGAGEFVILPSREAEAATDLSPDIATCPDCLRELSDPADRRCAYPFINCTNCGPRFSITLRVPYDRPNTTMGPFALCPSCAREYGDPTDRRFHAQPNACPACGPAVDFRRADKPHASAAPAVRGLAALCAAIDLLREGGILALKGLGGYQLACNALDAAAVGQLRERKRRSAKAFALMAPDVEAVRAFAEVSTEEEALLCSPERPIVLLARRPDCVLPDAVAPASAELGFLLPNTPLHWLLFHLAPAAPATAAGPRCPSRFRALVMTSGNRAEEPIVRDEAAAHRELAGFADAFLDHDRGIFMRVDDSVVRRSAGRTLFIRRARGYVPAAIALPGTGPPVLGCGAEVKNTFALTTPGAAVVSQHIGDLENHETLEFFLEALANLKAVYRVEPAAIAHDLHPGYFSTRWALEQEGVERWGVQHHWAHVASVLAEAGLAGPVIGVALDGSGYGPDGTVWGGEFLVAGARSFERVASFLPVPLPGGEGAIRHPWRMALSFVAEACGGTLPDQPAVRGLIARNGEADAATLLALRRNRALSPLSSGAGRLFEAVAALAGLCDRNSFEGEAAMRLEAAAAGQPGDPYPFAIVEGTPARIDFSPSILGLLDDLGAGKKAGLVAARLHATVAAAVVEQVARTHRATGIRDVALSGGVFQNRLLLGAVERGVAARGLRTHTNTRVPANDGGISLGQAYLLRERLR
ncbi:MAG TPA: carbamoyltransferase HypF [Candidatus Methanoperedens sp.]|nr:carbamoyltransferase HypF [Candidatus Methanoperedens sp.]